MVDTGTIDTKDLDKRLEVLKKKREEHPPVAEPRTLKERLTVEARKVGTSLKRTARERIEEDVYRQKRPRRSRAPVPGGRPKRPWIPSRRGYAPPPEDLVESLVVHGGEFLDMGVSDIGAGIGGGYDVQDVMGLGEDLLYGPRRSAPKRTKRRRRR